MRKRTAGIYVLLLLLLSGAVWRIYTLARAGATPASEQQAHMTVTVAQGRATLYDCNRQRLVNRETVFSSCIAPFPSTLTALSQRLPEAQWRTLSERLSRGRPVTAVLPGLYSSVRGLWQYMTPVRYTKGQLASHLIGYLDSENAHGITGIEEALDDYLTAHEGQVKLTFDVDANGRVLEGVEPEVENTLRSTQAGVVLTIDSRVQYAAETVAAKHMQRGAVVILEPKTGRVRAMVSLPTYDPADVAASLEQPHAPLLNRAIQNYNCGSVFKIVTAAAALESGLTPEQSFACSGSVLIGDRQFACHNRLGHGMLTMKNAFAQSCNPYFIQLAQQVGGQALYTQAAALGFDSAVLLADNYRTARALLPDTDALSSPGELSNLAIGQGGLLATPVHIAQLAAAVYNGGEWVTATVVQGYTDENGVYTENEPTAAMRAFSPQTAAILREFMENAVRHGTGTTAKPDTGLAGGKTGTAETGWVEDGVKVIQSWYAGFFETSGSSYAIAVVGEDKNRTGVRAAPLFKALCEALAQIP